MDMGKTVGGEAVSEYHFEGIRDDGSRWVLCGNDVVDDLGNAREIARKCLDERGFESVEIYVYERKVVEVVER